MPTIRRAHRLLGLLLCLPLLAWAATGAVFFLKPGYGAAYAPLAVRTYPLEALQTALPDTSWRETRLLRSALGVHLLVRTADGWRQADPESGVPRPRAADAEVRRLVEDAIAADPARYGAITSLVGDTVTTDTGARIVLDWDRLALSQRGRDTDRIDALYRIHYLQWTGITLLDRLLGAAGLAGLVLLALAGLRLARRSPNSA